MIIDSITHVTPDGHWFHTKYDASETRLLRELDEAGMDFAVIVPLAGYISNDFVLQLCKKYPNRLLPGASFDPSGYPTARESALEFRNQIQGAPYRVLKLHPRFNKYDPLDPRCLAVLEELASWECRMPVWLDTLFYYQGCKLQKSVVDSIHTIVGQFPSLQFILLHGGGSWLLQVAEAIWDCPNAWMDISFILRRYQNSSIWNDLRFLLQTFDRRMVFGSDFPEIGPKEALGYFQQLADGAPMEKRNNVLSKNLHTMFFKEEP